MPIYEYECTACHRIDEVIQKFSDKPLTRCRHCSGKLQKLISQSTFHLKGTGWYVTDYANRSGNTSTTGEKKGEPPAAKAEKSKTDTSKSKEASGTSDSTP